MTGIGTTVTENRIYTFINEILGSNVTLIGNDW